MDGPGRAAKSLSDVAERYRVLGSLGRGAGGDTFEAIRVTDGARVALKRLAIREGARSVT